MNIITSVAQFNFPQVIAYSTLDIKKGEGEVNYGKLKKGLLNGKTVVSSNLDAIEGIEDLQEMNVSEEFYEVHIELDGASDYFYAATKEECLPLAVEIAKTTRKRAYLHCSSAILAVVNEMGEVTKSVKYSTVFLDVDPELDEYLNIAGK